MKQSRRARACLGCSPAFSIHFARSSGSQIAARDHAVAVERVELTGHRLSVRGDAIRATADETAAHIREMEEDEAMTRQALELLESSRNDTFEAALAALRDDTREWWEDVLACDPDELEEDEEPATADAECLNRFLERKGLSWYVTRKKELANRPLIREQAFGEAFDPDKLERLGRYEVHLDRKLERTLTILIRQRPPTPLCGGLSPYRGENSEPGRCRRRA